MDMIRRAALLLVLHTLSACSQPANQPLGDSGDSEELAATPVIRPLSTIIDSLKIDARSIGFKVHKAQRRFEVLSRGRVLKSYPCVLGEAPVGDKLHQGDRRTPEGTFTFRSKRVHAQWHKFIWVDYPNAESWRRFNERKTQGLIPRGKDIGGEIGIHGVPDGMDHWVDSGADWTWGCIALKNADVDEIYPLIIPERTMMEVVP